VVRVLEGLDGLDGGWGESSTHAFREVGVIGHILPVLGFVS
jgi:hypothetical protein